LRPAGHDGATSVRLQAFDSDSESDEVPPANTAAANGQPASKARRSAAQDEAVTHPASVAVQLYGTSAEHDMPAVVESEDEAQAPDSYEELDHRERDIEASEADSTDVSDATEPAAAAEAEPQPAKSDSGDLSSDEGTEVPATSLPHEAQTHREVLADTADSDSDEELEQQQEYPTGRQLRGGDESDSEPDASAAADSDAAGGDSEGGANEDQHEDDVAAPATGHSSVDPDGEVEAPAMSVDERGEDEQLTIDEDGPSIPAGYPAAALVVCYCACRLRGKC